jgi:hypothetical protein
MEEGQVKRDRGRPKKTIRETIRKDLEVNELNPNMIFDKNIITSFGPCSRPYLVG